MDEIGHCIREKTRLIISHMPGGRCDAVLDELLLEIFRTDFFKPDMLCCGGLAEQILPPIWFPWDHIRSRLPWSARMLITALSVTATYFSIHLFTYTDLLSL